VLLENKNAVIYGAGGAVGVAVARAFARDGARIFLAGRTLDGVQAVAKEITAAGGTAEAAEVDALDEQAVERHLADVASKVDSIDILFNAIGMRDIQGTPLVDMPLADFAQPVIHATKTQFVTARAVARRMVRQGSGVLMTITAEPTPAAGIGGFGVACAAVEGMWRSLSAELGPYGVRCVVVRSPGSPDTPGVQAVFGLQPGEPIDPGIVAELGSATLMGRLPMVAEIADAAVLMASDRASAITAAMTNATCGAHVDL
jgi:NAD(P)-dependent dehydrogenase (short-subunit alcohol dehydrogenase family)